MLLSNHPIHLTILGLANSAAAFTFYQSWGNPPSDPSKCSRGAPGDFLVDGHYFHLGTGCTVDGNHKDQSMIVKAGDGDAALVAVFFSSDDCDPDTIIAVLDEATEIDGKTGCFDGNRNITWESGVYESRRELWRVNGVAPPARLSEMEKRWFEEGRVTGEAELLRAQRGE
ncbi:hypothetical protein COL922a_010212 [Colletotrichum nupharicola]|nr:hypothetical protein COL922a_010212 [Colletotrichum nupharicola]